MNAASRCAVVTGAAGAIGQAIVHEFAAAGYEVAATDCVPAPAGLPAAFYLEADLARTVEDEACAGEVFGRLHGWLGGRGLAALVNNAAVQVLGGVDLLQRQDWRATLDVNLLAPFFWAQALLPALQAAQGCVVNISSIHARLTKPGFVAYATSKAALSGLTRAMAVDLGPRVRVNAIEPAAIATPMLQAGFEGRPELLARLQGCHPVGRIGQAREVAVLALAMVEGRAGFMHGACVPLDGGIGGVLHDPA